MYQKLILKPTYEIIMAFLVHIFLLSLMLSSTFSSPTKDTMSQGSALSVENPADILVSENGMFTAGFHPVGENAYSFAIWYTKPIPDHSLTIVWMANRDHPVNRRYSKLSLTKDGNLMLKDANLLVTWETNTYSYAAKQLVLQNNGNLVLLAGEDKVLWQSFDSPTDTLLPGQPLTRSTTLISSRSENNFSTGLYRLFFDDDNVLRLGYNGPEASSIYWPDLWLLTDKAGISGFNDTKIAVFNSQGYFRSSDGTEFRAADFSLGPQRRLTLDFDGNLRLYSLLESSATWMVSWQALLRSSRIHGACGSNGLCSFKPESGRKCSCLPGFKMKNVRDWLYGCEPEFHNSVNNSEMTFREYPSLDFFGYNIRIFRNETLESCKNRCLELNNCKGFLYRVNDANGVYDCYPKWAFRNGHFPTMFSGAVYVKVPKSLSFPTHQHESFNLDCSNQRTELLNRNYKRRQDSKLVWGLLWVASILGGIETIFIVSIWLFLRESQHGSDESIEKYIHLAMVFRKFSYDELKKASKNFSEEIGKGSAGVVYKGVLPDGRIAAIKKLYDVKQGEAEFLAEVNIIGKINHMNLIEMWGYCVERKHRLLVYEFADQGSLAQNLYSNSLDWKKRHQIALGTAKGLAYLHEECLEWVLHCDVKPQNILLDSNYQPKLADFGLSKLVNRGGENNSSFSGVRGTRGYMAPEWIFNHPITSKVDVYSYGVVVLELVTGERVNAASLAVEGVMEETRLVKWVKEKVNGSAGMSSSIEEVLVEPQIHDNYEKQKMEQLVRVALQCAEEDKNARPTMRQVIEMLQCDEQDF